MNSVFDTALPQETLSAFQTDNPAGDGTADGIQANIPIGAFVLPAATVSQLGRGDTQSGLEALQRAFGALTEPSRNDSAGMMTDSERKASMAPLGTLDSSLSRGEYVIPPDWVKRVGQGDITEGARRLSGLFNVPMIPNE